MSELGQSEKSGHSTGRSALPPTPDMASHRATDVLCQQATFAASLNHLVGASK